MSGALKKEVFFLIIFLKRSLKFCLFFKLENKKMKNKKKGKNHPKKFARELASWSERPSTRSVAPGSKRRVHVDLLEVASRACPQPQVRDLHFVISSINSSRFRSDLDFGQLQRLARSVSLQNTFDRLHPTLPQPFSNTNENSQSILWLDVVSREERGDDGLQVLARLATPQLGRFRCDLDFGQFLRLEQCVAF